MVRRWLPLILLGVIVPAVAIYVARRDAPQQYEATATIIVGEPDANYDALLAGQIAAYYGELATTPDILLDAGSTVDEPDPEALGRKIAAQSDPESPLLRVSATDTDPADAAAIANAVAARIVEESIAGVDRPEYLIDGLASLRIEIEDVQEQIAALIEAERAGTITPEDTARLGELRVRQENLWSTWATLTAISNESGSDRLRLASPALPPRSSSSPGVLFYVLLAAAAGFILATGLAFVLEYLNERVGDPDVIEEATGLTTLGQLTAPRAGRLTSIADLALLEDPTSDEAEAFRTLRANIEFRGRFTTIAVVGSDRVKSVSAVAANLAVAFAQTGRRVVLVDADLRAPGLHTILGTSPEPGLTTLLSDPSLPVDLVLHDVLGGALRILPAGAATANPADWLALPQMERFLSTLSEAGDITILVGSPLAHGVDGLVVSGMADATLLLVDRKASSRVALTDACDALKDAHANVIGVALVKHARGRLKRPSGAARGAFGSGTSTGESSSGRVRPA